MTTDLTFFTNEPGATLLDRFKSTLQHTQYFDVLVGYFRTSGFYQLYKSLEETEKIRILVGINVDRDTATLYKTATQLELPANASKKIKDVFSEQVISEYDNSPDNQETEISVRKFVEFIKNGKLEIKGYKRGDLHAKVYITRYDEKIKEISYGSVITGSSNFTQSGLIDQREFNVELKNRHDVIFALDKFNLLWDDAIDISDVFVETINTNTWLNDEITPYELYLKFLYEYFKEDINADEEMIASRYIPEGFMELKYQNQAVISAKKILDAYNGVFIADVVGLGKTYIAALLAQQLSGRILVICPPVLKEYWEDTFFDFKIGGFKVESLGKLESIIKNGTERYDYIFIDEAHRFRNETTGSFDMLQKICIGKKVVLISATPLNNKPDDIFSQLKLFQIPKKSTIPGVPNLENFFRKINTYLKGFDRKSPEYITAVKDVSKDIREKIFKYIMVRRTRKEVCSFFKEDIEVQGLFFPSLADPNRLVYQLYGDIENAFDETVSLLKEFKYARYTPVLYLKRKQLPFEQQQQINVGGFMKTIIVKRLESSFFAFKNTINRFIESNIKFIQMVKDGTVYISKKVNVYDFLDNDNIEELIQLVDDEKVIKYDTIEFDEKYLEVLETDLNILYQIQSLWKNIDDDPKFNRFKDELQTNEIIKDKQILVFTESKETGIYLYNNLNKLYPSEVFFYSSEGATYQDDFKNKAIARDLIKENYDPKNKVQNNDIKILITTDVLAEGINLHRSNIIVNYDLPWNPTRVLQRVGRVNRVGTKHNDVYIFNFFPSSHSEEHLNLEANIIAKIQAFHDTLGEDAKYLTDDEEISTHNLFGDTLLKKLSSKETYETEEETDISELEFLKDIRDIRNNDIQLYEKIKRLPKKSRTARTLKSNNNQVVTFFRRGNLKKFYNSSNGKSEEIGFYDATILLKCDRATKKEKLPKDFYDLLNKNKEHFDFNTDEILDDAETSKGKSNTKEVIKYLKFLQKNDGFTDEEDEFIKEILEIFINGVPSKKLSKSIMDDLKKLKEPTPIKIFSIIKKHTESLNVKSDHKSNTIYGKREVILSEYIIKK